MFYTRINKIKVFNNRKGFLGLFNNAEMQIYSHAAGYSVGITPPVPSVPPVPIVPTFGFENEVENKNLSVTTDKV
ncbi:MAG: hypothetical protein LBL07_14730 [Tannerella sp.]|nr:hypothetical protein [Tannerella sp.]